MARTKDGRNVEEGEMIVRLMTAATIFLSGTAIAAAGPKCITDQPLDAQGRSSDKSNALEAAMKAWQYRVADKVANGEKFDPARADRWTVNVRKDKSTGEYIVNVSGIPCY